MEGTLTPILQTSECTFAYIKYNNLYVVSTSKKNANIALVFAFLHKIVQVMTEYFKELEEESIRDNFVVIYELLDELLDFGYPQTTDSKILQEYVSIWCLICNFIINVGGVQVHYTGGPQAGGSTTATSCSHQRGLVALGRNQVPQE
jgi:Clathrin adaptor complex small chain